MTETSVPSKPHVVIVGGGFGGLYAAKALGRLPVRVTLIDRRNHHLFAPLLYQVATAALSPAYIAQPLRSILHRLSNVRVQLAQVTGFNLDTKTVELSDGAIAYDYLIVAAGSTDNYFGHDDWASHAPGLKSLEAATAIRSKFLIAFELAARETDAARRQQLLTFVLIGAGPTGVELAGTMAEMAHTTLSSDFPELKGEKARIVLLEGAPRVLTPFPEDLSASALKQLLHLGVEVRLNAKVTRIDSDAVYVGDEKIETATVFWAAGVRGSALGAKLGVTLDRAGRVPVQPDLSLAGHANVFVIGDMAAAQQDDGTFVPGLAPAAMQMGGFAAASIHNDIKGKPRDVFKYWDKGNLATIGRAAAVGQMGKIHISGFIAWLAWMAVHVYFLIGFQNRLLVMLQWASAYLTFKRPARLITYTEDNWPDLSRPAHTVDSGRPL